MELINQLLQKHNLPTTTAHYEYFDNCLPVQIKRNKFPNSCLEFTNNNFHTLTADNSLGISEALIVLDGEFNNVYPETDPNADPVEYKKYSHILINNQEFYELNEQAIEQFIEYRTAQLYLNATGREWATIYIRLFVETGDEAEPYDPYLNNT